MRAKMKDLLREEFYSFCFQKYLIIIHVFIRSKWKSSVKKHGGRYIIFTQQKL